MPCEDQIGFIELGEGGLRTALQPIVFLAWNGLQILPAFMNPAIQW